MRPFQNRADAGTRLAAALACREWADPVVFGLVRGGLPVAAPVAEELDAPLELLVARKISAPGRPELGLGAVAADGPPFFDRVEPPRARADAGGRREPGRPSPHRGP